MNKLRLIICFIFLLPVWGSSQLTTPVIKANFGVEADLTGNFYNNSMLSGNDDWFNQAGYTGSGKPVIDTTGASAIVAGYLSDPNSRKVPFSRGMAYPPYSVVNNYLLLDAGFYRDYHGDDSTVFSSGSKNGMSPQNWICPVSSSVPDKNELLDMMVHVRRDGPNATDSLWLFAGVSIESTNGDRYFDFEMYQTDFYYDPATRQFYNYGPDAGHTSWKFDAAGNVIQPGDIIFSANYSSSALTSIEARIWVDASTWSTVTPASFSWTGTFDGASAGSSYGYAGIGPKSGGNFYMGTESLSNTWSGPFGLIRADNTYITTYTAGQFMEFAVNLTKLGLDPVTLLAGDACGRSFHKVMVKSRASTSFTASLKDFITPVDFFTAQEAKVSSNTPYICDSGSVSQLQVTNPLSTSTYVWSTTDGTISGSNTGTSIYVTAPGTYVVTQYLQAGCSPYATDTLQVQGFDYCKILHVNNVYDFNGFVQDQNAHLKWSVLENKVVQSFVLERSTDGVHFSPGKNISPDTTDVSDGFDYRYTDDLSAMHLPAVYYRLKIKEITRLEKYSTIIRLPLGLQEQAAVDLGVSPNPARNYLQLTIYSPVADNARIQIFDATGRLISTDYALVQRGSNRITNNRIVNLQAGIYQVAVVCNNTIRTKKFIIVK